MRLLIWIFGPLMLVALLLLSGCVTRAHMRTEMAKAAEAARGDTRASCYAAMQRISAECKKQLEQCKK